MSNRGWPPAAASSARGRSGRAGATAGDGGDLRARGSTSFELATRRFESDYTTAVTNLPSNPRAWRAVKAPSLADREVLAGEIFRRLPRRFRDLCANIVIQVDDFPRDEVLDQMGAET